jgi:hypothetical protein
MHLDRDLEIEQVAQIGAASIRWERWDSRVAKALNIWDGIAPLRSMKGAAGQFRKRGFLTAGFRIWNEHMRVSSTLIIAPLLSNSPQ